MKKTVFLSLLAMIALSFFACEKNDLGDTAIITDPSTEVYGTGLIENEDLAGIPSDLPPLGGVLPAKVDLTYLLPPIGHQGLSGTCVAWAVAYYMRTAMEALAKGLSPSQLASHANQFSPKDLYLAIPNEFKPDGCDKGTYIQNAMEVLQERGVATLQTVPFADLGSCYQGTSPSADQEAGNFTIQSFRKIETTVVSIKEKLAEDKPVVFGAIVTQAFHDFRGSGKMTSSSILNSTKKSGHAMTIVGYDDVKGAFRIVNSWGTYWGDNGFAWVDYDLMTDSRFIMYAFVAIPNPNDPDNPPVLTGANLAAGSACDKDNEDQWDLRQREINFNVINNGNTSIPSSQRWSVIYMYYNAYNMNDYGVLLHEYVTNEFGPAGSNGFYGNGIGITSSWWYNLNLAQGGDLATAMFGQPTPNINWEYQMPDVTGFYYLVVYVDPFNALAEENENDNFWFITNQKGGPVWFQNGVGQGFQEPGVLDDRSSETVVPSRTAVNSGFRNAYTPEEVRRFISLKKENGELKLRMKAIKKDMFKCPTGSF